MNKKSSSAAIKPFKLAKNSVNPPKVLPTYNLALSKLERDPVSNKAESGFLSERHKIKERHFTTHQSQMQTQVKF